MLAGLADAGLGPEQVRELWHAYNQVCAFSRPLMPSFTQHDAKIPSPVLVTALPSPLPTTQARDHESQAKFGQAGDAAGEAVPAEMERPGAGSAALGVAGRLLIVLRLLYGQHGQKKESGREAEPRPGAAAPEQAAATGGLSPLMSPGGGPSCAAEGLSTGEAAKRKSPHGGGSSGSAQAGASSSASAPSAIKQEDAAAMGDAPGGEILASSHGASASSADADTALRAPKRQASATASACLHQLQQWAYTGPLGGSPRPGSSPGPGPTRSVTKEGFEPAAAGSARVPLPHPPAQPAPITGPPPRPVEQSCAADFRLVVRLEARVDQGGGGSGGWGGHRGWCGGRGGHRGR